MTKLVSEMSCLWAVYVRVVVEAHEKCCSYIHDIVDVQSHCWVYF